MFLVLGLPWRLPAGSLHTPEQVVFPLSIK
jgi:hypothetical protein